MSRDDCDRDQEDSRPRQKKSGGGAGLIIGILVGVGLFTLCLCGGVGALFWYGYQRVGFAAERMVASNNLKQIGLAMHNYHDTNNSFPPVDGKGRDGKPTLSWRVHLLPYIEQDGLYQRFRLDEPWDSPNNRMVLDSVPMPPTYAFGKMRPGQKTTPFRVFLGGGAAFERGKRTRLFGADRDDWIGLNDGSSNTLLVVEATDEVTWTRPDELDYAPGAPLPRLGAPERQGFLALLADGSVRFVSRTTSEATIRGAITRNGGEPLGPDW